MKNSERPGNSRSPRNKGKGRQDREEKEARDREQRSDWTQNGNDQQQKKTRKQKYPQGEAEYRHSNGSVKMALRQLYERVGENGAFDTQYQAPTTHMIANGERGIDLHLLSSSLQSRGGDSQYRDGSKQMPAVDPAVIASQMHSTDSSIYKSMPSDGSQAHWVNQQNPMFQTYLPYPQQDYSHPTGPPPVIPIQFFQDQEMAYAPEGHPLQYLSYQHQLHPHYNNPSMYPGQQEGAYSYQPPVYEPVSLKSSMNPNAPSFVPKLRAHDDTNEDDAAMERNSRRIPIVHPNGEVLDVRSLAPEVKPKPTNSQVCLVCEKEAQLECRVCRDLHRRFGVPTAFFCSPEHQKEAWPRHHAEVHMKFANKATLPSTPHGTPGTSSTPTTPLTPAISDDLK